MTELTALERFKALDTKQQARILDEHRWRQLDHGWWETTRECFKASMRVVGIEVEKIYFSGFSSQGDGACFEGSVYDWARFLPSVGVTCPALLAHAEDNVRFSVEHSGHYYHENSTRFICDLPDPEGEVDGWFLSAYSPFGTDREDIRNIAWLTVLRTHDFAYLEDKFTEAFKGHMRQLYSDLSKEHDYLVGDEATLEYLDSIDQLTEIIDELEEELSHA